MSIAFATRPEVNALASLRRAFNPLLEARIRVPVNAEN